MSIGGLEELTEEHQMRSFRATTALTLSVALGGVAPAATLAGEQLVVES